MHWNLKQRKYMASEKKDGKVFRGQWAYGMFFFSCIIAMVENKKAKAGKKRNHSGSSKEDVEESCNNNCDISFWIVFNWPEYGILSFAEHISREFLTGELDLL